MAQEEMLQNGGLPFEEEKSNFDIVEWIIRILRHWYLFVIGASIAFSLAYLKNRRVIERYLTTGTMIIKESSGGGYGSAERDHRHASRQQRRHGHYRGRRGRRCAHRPPR